jgi:hypothetical protein
MGRTARAKVFGKALIAILAVLFLHVAGLQPVVASDQPAADAASVWNDVKHSSSLEVLELFQRMFPDTVYANLASARIKELKGNAEASRDAGASDEGGFGPDSDPDALVKALQTALNTQRCNAGKVDGIWGRGSRRALARFAKHAGLAMSDEPTADVLAAVEDLPGPICPLECSRRQVERDGECVLKTCPRGQSLDRRGRCVDALRVCSASCRRKWCGPASDGYQCAEGGIGCLMDRCRLSNEAANRHFHDTWVPILNR